MFIWADGDDSQQLARISEKECQTVAAARESPEERRMDSSKLHIQVSDFQGAADLISLHFWMNSDANFFVHWI